MKTIRLRGTQVHFPNACVVCLGYTHHEFKIERTFTYGRRTILLSVPVPLCSEHYKQASAKSPAQLFCERIGPVAGAGFGVAVCAALLWYWSASGQGKPLFNIPVALVAGLCMATLLWAMLRFWVAPLFASAETKMLRNSVRMTKYDPFHQTLELAFANDTAAELTARENITTLIPAANDLQPYRISAHILDHDIRLSDTIKTQVLLDHRPTEEEAKKLLQPVIDRLLVQQMGEDTFYDLESIKIEEGLSA